MKSAAILVSVLASAATIFAQLSTSTTPDQPVQPEAVAVVLSNLPTAASNSTVLPVVVMTNAEPAAAATNPVASVAPEPTGGSQASIPSPRTLIWCIIGALLALAALVAGTRKPAR